MRPIPSKSPLFVFEALGSLACGFYGNYIFFLFRDRHGFGNLGNLGVAALMGLVIALASWQGGKFAQRNGCIRTMVSGLLGMIVALTFGAFFSELPVQFAVLILWTASQFIVWPALEALVTEGENGSSRANIVGIFPKGGNPPRPARSRVPPVGGVRPFTRRSGSKSRVRTPGIHESFVQVKHLLSMPGIELQRIWIMRKLNPIPMLHLTVCLTAIAVLALTGCRESEESQPAAALPEKVARVERFEDLRALIAAELASGNKRIVVPPGRYRVPSEQGFHLQFKNLSDVEIIAENVEMVCTSTVQAVLFDHCSNVTLRGLVVDYDPLPFTQGKIISMTPDKSSMDFEVAEGYPENKLEERIQIYDPVTGELRRGDANWKQEIQALGARRYRVEKNNHRFNPVHDTEQVGDILVTNNTFGVHGSPHAVELKNSKGVHLEDITVFASPCFGFLEYDSDGTRYIRCKVDRRDLADDPVKRALPRMRSLNADAFHSKDAIKGPAIIGCKAHFQGDDCVNINGHYHYVSGSSGRLLRIAVMGKPRIKAGDPVEFLPHSGPRPPDAVAVKMEPDPTPITDDEKALISKLGLNENIRTGLLTGKAVFYTLTLDREIVLPGGSAVCSSLRVGNGFVVKDCDFGHNRSRGILIKASQGEVISNRIVNSRMAAVLVSPEFWWMEAASSSDVVVKDNIIEGCLQSPIQILAPGGNGRALPSGAHRNVSITGNRIVDSAWPLIRVTSTKGLIIKSNEYVKSPPAWQTASSGGKIHVAIELEQCEDVESIK
jgi:hypothetical protein